MLEGICGGCWMFEAWLAVTIWLNVSIFWSMACMAKFWAERSDWREVNASVREARLLSSVSAALLAPW